MKFWSRILLITFILLLSVILYPVNAEATQVTEIFNNTFNSNTEQWYKGGTNGSLTHAGTLSNGQLSWQPALDNTNSHSTQSIGRSFNDTTLVPGETLRLTFNYRQTGTSVGIIRAGIYKTNGQITANDWVSSGGSYISAYDGYYTFMRDNSNQGHQARHQAHGSSDNLLGPLHTQGITNITNGTANTMYPIVLNTQYTGVFEITRASATQIDTKFTLSSGTTTHISVSGTTSQVRNDFNMVAIRGSGGTMVFDYIKLEKISPTYTVTLNKQSGTGGTNSVTATYGSAMPSATAPTRAGYTFTGYWDATSGGTRYYTNTMSSARAWDKTADTILYARWTANTYTVTLNKQSGTGGTNSVTATYGSAMPSATAPTRAGYTFTGYWDATSGGTRYYTNTMSSARAWDKTADTILYARWTANTYTVTLNKQSGTGGTNSVIATYDSAMPLGATAPTRAGYTFAGYFDATSGGTQYYTASMTSARTWNKTSNATLYARWTANSNTAYKVEHYQQDVTGAGYTLFDTDNLTGTTATQATAVVKIYTGFSENTAHADRVPSGTIAGDGSLVLKRYYDRITYTVDFNSNDGSAVNDLTGVRHGATIQAPTAPIRAGYTFGDWYSDDELNTVYDFNTSVTSTITIYASWNLDTYNITYNLDEGTNYSGAPENYTMLTETITLGTPIKTGYSFAGWYDEAEGGNQVVTIAQGSTGDKTVYARWTANTDTAYKVEHYQQDVTGAGYTLFETENLTGTTATQATAVAKTYTGFSENDTHGDRVASDAIAGDGSLVLKLYYDRNTYNVSFNSNEGSAVGEITGVRHGATIIAPTAPTRAGYSFGGWYKEIGLTNLWVFAPEASPDTVTQGITLFASWTANTNTAYQVEHYQQDVTGAGYTLFDTDNLTGTTATQATAVVKIYTGFSENTTHADRVPSGTIAGDGSLVLKLYYDRNTYTVSFNSNEGSAVGEIPGVRHGATIQAPPAPTRAGYSFGGWYSDESLDAGYDFNTPVTATITIYASWNIDTYNITYNLDEGTNYSGAPENYTMLTETITLGTPTRTGYSFAGWYGATEGGSQVTIIAQGSTGDKTVYARWTANTDTAYKVEHYQQDVTGSGYTLFETENLTGKTSTTSTAAAFVYTGFSENDTHGDRVASDAIAGDGSLVLKLYYDRNTYTVSFNSNEGSAVDEIPGVRHGATIQAPTAPTRASYAFGGWYKEEILTTVWDFTTDRVLAEDVTLYAKWIADTIVSYNDMDISEWQEFTDSQASEFFATYSIDQINNLNLEALNQLTTKLTPEQYQTHKETLGVVYTPEKMLNNLTNAPVSTLNMLPAELVEDVLNNSLSSAELLTLGNDRLAELINDLSVNYEAINDALLVEILNSLPEDIITGTIKLDKIIDIVNAVSDKTAFSAKIQEIVQPAPSGGGGGGGTTEPTEPTETEPTTIIASPVPAEQIAETTETETAIGKETSITTTDGRNIAIVQIAKDKITEKIQELINQRPTEPATLGTGETQVGTGEQQTRSEQRSQREQNTVEIATTTPYTDTISAQVTGDIVKAMEIEEITIAVKTNNIQYIIPAKEIGIDRVAENLKVATTNLAKIVIEIKIETATTAKTEKIEQRASQRNAEIVLAPVSFQVIAHTTSSTGETSSHIITNFNQYVERIIELPADIDPRKITTGIIYDDNGTFDHIPTEVYEQAGKWIVRLSSLTNSDYTIIYSPITVETVQGHWSEEIVNDMASRIVIAAHLEFAPNEAITRGEFADYIVKALGIYRVGAYQQGLFRDINILNKHRDAITTASKYGIIKGYEDQTFRAEATITRQEAMTMYARAMDIAELRETEIDLAARYTDETQISAWAYDYVQKTVSGGVFQGKTATTINPLDTLTNAEAATAIRNMLIAAELIKD